MTEATPLPTPLPTALPTPAEHLLATQLRAALCAFVAQAGSRRSLPTHLHLGTPGGEHLTIPHDPWYDAGLRADLVTRALDGLLPAGPGPAVPCPWLTRAGDLDPVDADLQWFSAVTTGYQRHGLVLPGFFVMTRRGWTNVATREQRLWRRVRPARMTDRRQPTAEDVVGC